ncbi:MAG: DUF1048 domain-containing protein [Dermatophilaceae bacterium]
MKARWIEQLTGSLEDKRRYRQHRARVSEFPDGYREAVQAFERYLTYRGAITKSDVIMAMLDDLADLFEQSAADGTTIREVVGEDPVAFAETFLENYSDGQWIAKERDRLTRAIDAVVVDRQ